MTVSAISKVIWNDRDLTYENAKAPTNYLILSLEKGCRLYGEHNDQTLTYKHVITKTSSGRRKKEITKLHETEKNKRVINRKEKNTKQRLCQTEGKSKKKIERNKKNISMTETEPRYHY